MKPYQASLTAQGAAVLRAVESERKPASRVCYDPYARMQVGRRLTACGDVPLPQWAASWLFRRLWPGFAEYVAARTHYFDSVLDQRLQDGVQQVVILGAGYDSRAYRFSDRLRDVPLFEVDHPSTQHNKQQRLLDLFGQLPQQVTYVSADLNQDALIDRLTQAGYNPAVSTLFLWEGVTYYLDPEAVAATLESVARHSGPGSSIGFDYTFPNIIDGTCRRREAVAWRKYAISKGEALKFGIESEALGSYLALRGLAPSRQGPADWRYQAKPPHARPSVGVTPIFAIAHAGTRKRGHSTLLKK